MAKNWPYAQLATEAYEAGGPEALIKAIKEEAYHNGVSDAKNALVAPVMLVGIGLGAVCVCAYQKIKKMNIQNNEERLLSAHEAVQAEELLKKELENTIEKTTKSSDENGADSETVND